MVTVIYEDRQVSVPHWVTDLDSFRRWVDADDFPETGHVWWLKGEVWVDMSKEQIFTHLMVKGEFTVVLGSIVRRERLGRLIPDGLLLSNYAADVSGNPDATFLSADTLRSDRVRLIEGKEGGYVEVQGSPDMVLEVVSPSSKHKDRVVLRRAYWEAGVREYWLADALADPPQLDIFRHGARGYVTVRKHDGWVKSTVFGRSFRLTRTQAEDGHPDFQLETQPALAT